SVPPQVPVLTLVNDDVGTITGNVLNNGNVTNDTTTTLSVTGEPGTQVSIYDDGVLMATVTVDRGGAWSYPVPVGQALGDRDHNITLPAPAAAGN
ncbi:Ig-like domain-containing protein, partial [Yokenella regensburgei]|uniref:Ig-like domain-containing protein n=1 Tax=Yokenella regensburgei TaxID=158877 RepID=UPI003ED936A1